MTIKELEKASKNIRKSVEYFEDYFSYYLIPKVGESSKEFYSELNRLNNYLTVLDDIINRKN